MTTRNNRRWLTLIPFVLLCGGAIAVGQLFPPDEWYASLKRPTWAPPNWIFGVVWTPLYAMIAISGWLLWSCCRDSLAMKLWFVQLTLNAAWTWIFFGLHRPGAALVEIVVLWFFIGATIVAAWPRQKGAAALLVPYWLWVAFAILLNAAYWRLN